MPQRAFAFGRDRRHVDEVVFGAVRAHAASAQIDRAFGGIEQPQIRVPLVGGGCETPIGSCQPFNCGDGLRAHQFFCWPCLVAFGRRHPADHPHAVEDGKGIVQLPAHAVVTQPLVPFRAVAQIIGVQRGETQRQCVVGKWANINLGLLAAPLLQFGPRLASAARQAASNVSTRPDWTWPGGRGICCVSVMGRSHRSKHQEPELRRAPTFLRHPSKWLAFSPDHPAKLVLRARRRISVRIVAARISERRAMRVCRRYRRWWV